MQNIIDPCNAGEHYQSFIRNENTKPVKQWKIITKERKLKKKRNIKLKSVNIEHPKTSYKITKTTKQAEKVSEINSSGKNFNSALYSDTTKCVNCFGQKR